MNQCKVGGDIIDASTTTLHTILAFIRVLVDDMPRMTGIVGPAITQLVILEVLDDETDFCRIVFLDVVLARDNAEDKRATVANRCVLIDGDVVNSRLGFTSYDVLKVDGTFRDGDIGRQNLQSGRSGCRISMSFVRDGEAELCSFTGIQTTVAVAIHFRDDHAIEVEDGGVCFHDQVTDIRIFTVGHGDGKVIARIVGHIVGHSK